jgi:hypothetical protein
MVCCTLAPGLGVLGVVMVPCATIRVFEANTNARKKKNDNFLII